MRVRTGVPLSAVILLLFAIFGGDIRAQTTGTRVAARRGGEVSFEPKGPGVLFGALDPAVRRWYVPQELFYEFQWKQWEYTNYAKTIYQRYVDVALEGDYFYDTFGNFTTRGWLIYDWRQEQPTNYGSQVFKDRRFNQWFSNVLITSDSKGRYHYTLTVGDQIRTMLTPMTFSKPAFNGIQYDFLSDDYAATLLLSRVNAPGVFYTPNEVPIANTNSTNLIGGRVIARLGDFVEVGGTYVNSYVSHTLRDAFQIDGNPFKGHLTSEQNLTNISFIEIRLSDDSPEDREGGAALFREEVLITDVDGNTVRSDQIGFEPVIEGGFERPGYRAADGDEVMRLRYDFTSPLYMGPPPARIKGVTFHLTVSNDYRIEVVSDRQTRKGGEPVYLLFARAEGNVKDNSNLRTVKIEYGLPTANEIYGLSLEIRDLRGFDLYSEFGINRRYVRYPNVDLRKHRAASVRSQAWLVNISKQAYPWFAFGEFFSMDDDYTTSFYLVDSRGGLDYENVLGFYEFVDDNDDLDLHADWQRYSEQAVDKAVFPGWDENGDFVSDFNQNDNRLRQSLLPDYEEPFLRYNADRPEYLFGMDMNSNGWVDRFENDEEPDYPYRRNHRGYNIYLGGYITPDMRALIGQKRAGLIASDRIDHTSYALFTWDRSFAGWGRLRAFEMIKLAKDNIPDHLFQWVQPPGSRGTQQRLRDPMLAENTWVNTSYLGFDYTGIENLNVINKLKYESYSQRDSEDRLALRAIRRHDRFLGLINKADYHFRVANVSVHPRWKSEFRNQTRDLITSERRKELTESGSMLMEIPLWPRTTLHAGYEWLKFNDMLDDENDFTEQVWGGQLTNVYNHRGYEIIIQMGIHFTERSFQDSEDSTGKVFVTIFGGLGEW